MTGCTLSRDHRRAYIELLAEQSGMLVKVTPAQMTMWRAEWKRLQTVICRPHHDAKAKKAIKRSATHTPMKGARPFRSRALPLPVQMGIPGTWLRFRPHSPHPVLPQVFQVVALVPPGVGLLDVLTADQFAALDRHILPGPCPSFTRVVVSVMGARRATGCLRAILAGELARSAEIIDAPEGNDLGTRLAAPLLAGSQVTWGWHSPHGRVVHSGVVLAYVAAGQSIQEVLPDLPLGGLHAVSNQDRYLIRLSTPCRKSILSPAAHIVERGVLEDECAPKAGIGSPSAADANL